MKRLKLFASALTVTLSCLLGLTAQHAFAATKTWTGGGSDNKMTTGANWGGSAPSAGDDLYFPANSTKLTVDNDFTAATSFNSIHFTGAATQSSSYAISGNSMTLVGGIDNAMTGAAADIYQDISLALTLNGTQTFQAANGSLTLSGTLNTGSSALTVTPGANNYILLTGVISGSGALTKAGAGTLSISGANSSYSGSITATAGTLYAGDNSALGATSAGTTISSGADIQIGNCSAMTVDEDITLTGSSSSSDKAKITTGAGCSGAAVDESYGTPAVTGDVSLTGDIALGSNVVWGPLAKKTTLTGALSGNFAISLLSGYAGQLVINSSSNSSQTANGTKTAPVLEITLSDSMPSHTVLVSGSTTITLTGVRGDMTINSGATLKGTGTTGILGILSGATIAPGMSPGCLSTGNLVLAGTYSFELGGTTACTLYDQIKVTGTVTAGGALNISLFNGFKPVVGQKYVIISNDSTDAVSGTFSGLAEGATTTVSGYTFSVSYKGGDGNDVQLTVTAVAPNTGFALLKNNPAITLAAVTGAGLILGVMARRTLKPATRRK